MQEALYKSCLTYLMDHASQEQQAAELASLRQEVEGSTLKQAGMRDKMQFGEMRYEELSMDCSNLKTQMNHLQTQLSSLQHELSTVRTESAKLQTERAQLWDEQGTLVKTVHSLRAQANTLEEAAVLTEVRHSI